MSASDDDGDDNDDNDNDDDDAPRKYVIVSLPRYSRHWEGA